MSTVKITSALPGRENVRTTSPFRRHTIVTTNHLVFATNGTQVWKLNHLCDDAKHALGKANQVNKAGTINLEHWTEVIKPAAKPQAPKPVSKNQEILNKVKEIVLINAKPRKTKADKARLAELTAEIS